MTRSKPGSGWRHLTGSVYEHESGMRVHSSGLVRMPDGITYNLNNIEYAASFALMIKINGGNRQRGLMAWAKNYLKLIKKHSETKDK